MTITQSFSKLSAVAAGIAVAFALIAGVFATATPARAAALTSAQVSSIISLLQSFGADAATIANVQASLTGGTPTTPTTPSTGTGGACPALTRDLQVGSTGADVMALQKFLNSSAATQVAASGAGSPGSETSTFGPATKAAAIKFQTSKGVTPAAGYVGAKTRAAIAAACGGTSTNPGTTVGSINVGVASQPANSIAPESASRVPFTTFTLSNNSSSVVTVNGVTVQRTGLGSDSVFAGVALVDGNKIQLGIAKTLNSNHQATVGDNFMLNPGETKTITVVGNMASNLDSYSGQIASLQVVAINSTASVGGSLPIMGASHTINSNLSIGTASAIVSSFDPNSTSITKSIGDTGVKFAGIRVTSGSAEAVRLWSVRWNQSGSAASSDLANVMTYVDGTAYPTTVSSDGKYYTATFSGGILIDKGLSKDIYVQGDVVGSSVSGRTVEFDIYKNTDVYLTGETYGYGVTVAPSGNTASSATDASQFLTSDGSTTGTPSTPFFSASKVTVNPGSATSISKATEVAAQNIAVNVPNQPLGGFVTDFKGEAVSVQQIVIDVSTTSTLGPITNATIVNSNGAVVAGPIDENQVTSGKLTFTDTVTFPVGRQVYTIKGKVASGAANNTTIQLTTNPSTQWTNVTGQVSGNSISLSGQGSFSMNTMTVQTASLTASMSAQPAAQFIVAGGSGILFANVQLDASASGEDVRLSAIPLRFSSNTGLSNCQIFDGSSALNTGSNVPSSISTSAANNFQFDNNLVVTKGTVKTLAVKCNTTSSATGGYTVSLNVSDTITATGITSGTSVSVTNSANSGATMTVGTSSVTTTVDSSSPSYALAAGGTTGVTVGVVNLHANNEAVTLSKLGLTLTSGSAAQLNSVTIWDGATQVGSAIFTGSNTTATSTLSTAVTLPKDADKTLTIKADLADIGSGQSGTDGALVKIDPNSSEGTGQASGNTLKTGASGNVAGVRIYNTFPTVALDTLSSTGIADGKLMRFKVTANAADKVGIGQFKFTLSTTTLTVTNVQLFAYTDSGYSTAISNQGTSGQIGNTVAAAQNGTAFTVAPNLNAVQVAAGTTLYFELRGSIAGNVSGASVVTTLNGDSSASPSSNTTTFGAVSGNFIWSPNATTTAATSTGNDWTNGYGVAGLPSSGLFQSRSN